MEQFATTTIVYRRRCRTANAESRCCEKALQRINSDVHIEAHIVDVTPTEFEWLIDGVNLIIDATDNFDIRMMINDMSQKHHIPWIYGSCVGSYAISYTILPNETPCLYCLME